jgi:single-stranded DNA-specific DHH superfamily exonuclease
MVVDHHTIKNDLNKLGVVHINPRFEKASAYISASHITWDICKKAGLTGCSWLARLGDVCDRAAKGSKPENEAAFIISAIEATDKSRLGELSRNLSDMTDLEFFVYNPKYQRIKERFSMEIRMQLENIDPLLSNNIVFYEIKSRYSLASILSSMLLDRYPSKTFLIYKKGKGFYHISGRSKKVNLVKAFEKACKGIGKSGGHPVAAGAEVKDIEVFKDRFLEIAGGRNK